MKRLLIDPSQPKPPTRDHPHDQEVSNALPAAKEIKVHPTKSGGEDASIFFVGTATTIMYAPTPVPSHPPTTNPPLSPENGKACA